MSSDTTASAQCQVFNWPVLHFNAKSSTEHCGQRETTFYGRRCHDAQLSEHWHCHWSDSLTLPYLRGGQVVTPAQCWGHISSAQCATPM